MKFQRQAILVLGMHRSGTSAIAGMLAKLGASPPKTLMPPTNDNPLGYWESLEFEKFHGRLLASAGSEWHDWELIPTDWYTSPDALTFAAELQTIINHEFGDASTFVVKDPRICRFVPFWQEQLKKLKIESKVVIPLRNPLEVAASLEKRDGITTNHALLTWLRHMLDAEATTRNLPRSFIRYEDLLSDWRSVVKKIGKELGIQWPRMPGTVMEEIESYLTRSFRHHRITEEQLMLHKGISKLVKSVYRVFNVLSGPSPVEKGLLLELDRMKQDFDTACNVFRPLVDETVASKDLFKGKMESTYWEMSHIIAGKDQTIAELTNNSINLQNNNAELINQLASRDATITGQNNFIDSLTSKLVEQNNVIKNMDGRINELSALAEAQVKSITGQHKETEGLAATIAEQKSTNDCLSEMIKEVTSLAENRERQIIEMTSIIGQNKTQIETLVAQNSITTEQFHEHLNSLSWRATGPVRYVISKFRRLAKGRTDGYKLF